MSCQILYLFDLDQCIPLEEKLESETLEFCISQIKDVCSRILSSASHLDGPNMEHRNTVHFSFKFYSSTGYFLVLDNHGGGGVKFADFHEDTFDTMETALSDRFESLLQTSKTNSFKAEDLKHHISDKASVGQHKCHAINLQKALEEIAVLFNWDRPLIHSPVKNQGRKAVNNANNAIYIFTKLPRTKEELGLFLGKPNTKRQFNHRDIQDRAFASKAILNILKGDAGVSINIIDTDTLRMQSETTAEDCAAVKSLFKKCLSAYKGNIIPFSAFSSDSCVSHRENPYSALMVANSYFEQSTGDKLPATTVKSSEVKLHWKNTTLSILCSESDVKEITIEKVVKNVCFQALKLLDLTQNTYLLLSGQHSVKRLCHFLIVTQSSALVNCDGQSGVLKAIDESHLSMEISQDNYSSSLLSAFAFTQEPENSIQQCFKLSTKLKLPSRKSLDDGEIEIRKEFFRGSFFESSYVPETLQPFKSLIQDIRTEAEDTDEELMESLRRSYLPKHLTKHPLNRKTSEESSETLTDNKNVKSKTKAKGRGAELLRLGSKTMADLRRNSSTEEIKSEPLISTVSSTSVNPVLEDWTNKFRSGIEHLKDCHDHGMLVKKLNELQIELLLTQDQSQVNMGLVAFAKTVVTSIGQFVLANQNSSKFTLEEMMEEFFLVDPNTVGKRKGSKDVRIRCHKLQILFRMEVSRVMPQQELRNKYLDQILVHLRQISIWDSANEMFTFLQEILTNNYINDQPEVLLSVYEELNHPAPECLRALFSPSKMSDIFRYLFSCLYYISYIEVNLVDRSHTYLVISNFFATFVVKV